MTICIKADSSLTVLGTGDFVHAFFSTVSVNLEPDGWGTRFPVTMNELYQGELAKASAKRCLEELTTIHEELKAYPPAKVVWDIEDRSKSPPWGDAISPDISSLSDYFVTSGGRDVFDVLVENIEYLIEEPECQSISLVSR